MRQLAGLLLAFVVGLGCGLLAPRAPVSEVPAAAPIAMDAPVSPASQAPRTPLAPAAPSPAPTGSASAAGAEGTEKGVATEDPAALAERLAERGAERGALRQQELLALTHATPEQEERITAILAEMNDELGRLAVRAADRPDPPGRGEVLALTAEHFDVLVDAQQRILDVFDAQQRTAIPDDLLDTSIYVDPGLVTP